MPSSPKTRPAVYYLSAIVALLVLAATALLLQPAHVLARPSLPGSAALRAPALSPAPPTPSQLPSATESDWSLYLPFVAKAASSPKPCSLAIVFDYVPPLGSNENLRGHIECGAPSELKVAVYINVSGWWTKPYDNQRLTDIRSDGTWTTDITTGGEDRQATDIVAFLVPNGYEPPPMSGGPILPQELYENAVAYTSATRRATRTIEFSRHTWQVKYSPIATEPGSNHFSDAPEDVWVDESGSLHLSIANRDGRWYCTEVICTDPLEYGTYTIALGSLVDLLDRNAVLGFFSWDTEASQYNYREIDIEFSRWGDAFAPNAQYVIQPWQAAGNRYRFTMNLPGTDSVHSFDWRADRVLFESRDGAGTLLQSWTYSQAASIPPAGGGSMRINLWLLEHSVPSDGRPVEVVVKSFEFAPADP